jgi:NADPH:quinone reductase-like Zn-dependent oxidoreductase
MPSFSNVTMRSQLTTRERPAPGNGEVLVRIKASGVNPLDLGH